jgi:hypothetical protein
MMTNAEEPLSREDQFVRTNNRRLLFYAAAFGLWQLADLLREHAAGGRARAALVALSLAAWATWAVLLVLSTRDSLRIKSDPVLRAAVQDERARDVRLRAYRFAFWMTLGTAALLGIPASAHLFAARAATTLVVVIGVASFIVSSVVLDRE